MTTTAPPTVTRYVVFFRGRPRRCDTPYHEKPYPGLALRDRWGNYTHLGPLSGETWDELREVIHSQGKPGEPFWIMQVTIQDVPVSYTDPPHRQKMIQGSVVGENDMGWME